MSSRSRTGAKEAWLELLVPERDAGAFAEWMRRIRDSGASEAIVFREKARGRTGDRAWLNSAAVRLAGRSAPRGWRDRWVVGPADALPPKATLEHLLGRWGRDRA